MGDGFFYQQAYEEVQNLVATARTWLPHNTKRARLIYRWAEEKLKIYAERHPEYENRTTVDIKKIREERIKETRIPQCIKVTTTTSSTREEIPSKLEVVSA